MDGLKITFNLSRVWQHFLTKDFAVISAHKPNYSEDENEKRSNLLKEMLIGMSAGYGFKEIKGV